MSPLDKEPPDISGDAEGAVRPQKWKGCATIYRAIEKALSKSLSNLRRRPAPVSRRGVVFAPARRELTLRRLGFPVVFYPRELHDSRHINEQVYIYIDVSGSMLVDSVMSFLFGLLVHLHDYIGDTLYQFTTRVRVVTMDQIRRGSVMTGGTDIAPVIEHALQNRFERIVVISDGDFGKVDDALATRAREDGLFIAYLITDNYRIHKSAESLGQVWPIHEELEELERETIEAQEGEDEAPGKAERDEGLGRRNRVPRIPQLPIKGC